MPEAYVNRITSALGEEARDVEETAACNKMVSSCDVIRQAGFARHHVCSEATTAYDLARRAVEELGAEIDGTGAIVYSTCIPANANLGSAVQASDILEFRLKTIGRMKEKLLLSDPEHSRGKDQQRGHDENS